MKALLTIAALMLTSAPALAQDETDIAISAVKDCLKTTGATLAKGSKENADVLADLTVYRCSVKATDLKQVAAIRSLNSRMIALDTIVAARAGI